MYKFKKITLLAATAGFAAVVSEGVAFTLCSLDLCPVSEASLSESVSLSESLLSESESLSESEPLPEPESLPWPLRFGESNLSSFFGTTAGFPLNNTKK